MRPTGRQKISIVVNEVFAGRLSNTQDSSSDLQLPEKKRQIFEEMYFLFGKATFVIFAALDFLQVMVS